MKKIYFNLLVAASLIKGLDAAAQMSGSYSIPGSFPTLAAAISSLNTSGVSGPVSINIAAGYTETAPSGGYALTATGTSVNPIVFQKSGNGANPLLTAYSGGTGTPGTAVQDGIWRLVGSDFITIVAIDLVDLNTTNPATMEFGYGLYKASATDGCQHNVIVACVITLSRNNNATGIMPAVHGSRGINLVNAIPSAHTTSLAITSASGANSNNGFNLNTIRDCNYAVALTGFADVSPYTFSDSENNFSGNTFLNFGGAAAATNPAGGLIATNQQKLVIAGNKINNNDGAGIDHVTDLYGIDVKIAGGSKSAIASNMITLHGGGTSSQVTAVQSSAALSTNGTRMEISGNTIRGCTYATATSGAFYGILNSAACDTLFMSGNNFYNNTTASGSGAYYNMYNSGTIASNLQISGNAIDTLEFTASIVSSTVCNIYCSGGANTGDASFNGNSVSNINFSGSTGATGMYACIYLTAGFNTYGLAGNNFNDLSLNSSGPVYMIYHNSTTPLVNVFGNNMAPSFSRTSNSGDTYFYHGNSSATSGTTAVSYNNVANVLQSGPSGFYGIANAGSALQYQEFAGNAFDSIISGSGITSVISMTAGSASNCYNNTIRSVNAAGPIYGINCNASLSTNHIYQNNISTFTGTGASTVCPIYIAAGSEATIYRNKIYDVMNTNAGGSAYGLYLAGSANTIAAQSDTIYNNLIGSISTPSASADMPLAGMYVAGGSNVHVWFNTIYLSAASTGSLFGSAALFAATNTGLDLKNNILVNTSSSTGTGVTSAYRRSSANLSTYLAGSDNNLFYAGPLAPGNAVFYDGTTAYAYLSAYKTLVAGRDMASVTENPPFINLLGALSNYLDIDPSIATQVESGGTPITVITDDYNAATRNTTTPDIGAWENNYTASGDLLPPDLFGFGFTNNNCSTTARTLTVNLTDVSGIANGIQAPTTYYKVNAGTYNSVQGTLVSGTPFNAVWAFNLSYAAAPLDVISYYIVAQDIAGTPNVVASPPNGFAGSSVSSIITPPSTLYTYSILPSPAIAISSPTFCIGSNASITSSVSGAATYSWSGPAGYTSSAQTALVPSVTNASAGIYTLTAQSAAGCLASATVNIVANTPPVVTASASSLNICAGESSDLSASGAANYSWMPGSALTQTVSVSPAASTVYTVTGVNAAGCTNTALVNLVVTVCTGINAHAAANNALALYPNPSNGMLTATFNFDGEKEIIITNTLGETVQHLHTQNTTENLDLSAFTKGIYFIRVISQLQKATSKIVIE